MNTYNLFRYLLIAGICIFQVHILNAQDTDVILSSIQKEVNRSKSELKIDKLQPPFFISYAVIETKYMNVTASLGSLLNSSQSSRRAGNPFLLVGDYDRNNIGPRNMFSYPKTICIENDPTGIATAIWQDLDDQYKNAAEGYEAKMSTIRQLNIPEEDLAVVDFEKKEPVQMILPTTDYKQDKPYWEEFAKKVSPLYRNTPT